jgi:hypothetical protein
LNKFCQICNIFLHGYKKNYVSIKIEMKFVAKQYVSNMAAKKCINFWLGGQNALKTTCFQTNIQINVYREERYVKWLVRCLISWFVVCYPECFLSHMQIWAPAKNHTDYSIQEVVLMLLHKSFVWVIGNSIFLEWFNASYSLEYVALFCYLIWRVWDYRRKWDRSVFESFSIAFRNLIGKCDSIYVL